MQRQSLDRAISNTPKFQALGKSWASEPTDHLGLCTSFQAELPAAVCNSSRALLAVVHTWQHSHETLRSIQPSKGPRTAMQGQQAALGDTPGSQQRAAARHHMTASTRLAQGSLPPLHPLRHTGRNPCRDLLQANTAWGSPAIRTAPQCPAGQ